jgi:hypothetical protein
MFMKTKPLTPIIAILSEFYPTALKGLIGRPGSRGEKKRNQK